jgi:hypothetical protein
MVEPDWLMANVSLPPPAQRFSHGRRNFKDTNPVMSSSLGGGGHFVWGGEAIW